MAIEFVAGSGLADAGTGVGVAARDLNVAQRDPGAKGRGDAGVAQGAAADAVLGAGLSPETGRVEKRGGRSESVPIRGGEGGADFSP